MSRFWRDVPLFSLSIELIFSSVPLLHENSPLCPAFLCSIYSTFLWRPAMSREIQRCVPLLSWLRLACMHLVGFYSTTFRNGLKILIFSSRYKSTPYKEVTEFVAVQSTHEVIKNSVVVIVWIASISESISVRIFLSGVRNQRTVVRVALCHSITALVRKPVQICVLVAHEPVPLISKVALVDSSCNMCSVLESNCLFVCLFGF